MKTILITVSPEGETQLETLGFAGAECQQASRFLEQALGSTIKEQLTSAYHSSHLPQQNRQQET